MLRPRPAGELPALDDPRQARAAATRQQRLNLLLGFCAQPRPARRIAPETDLPAHCRATLRHAIAAHLERPPIRLRFAPELENQFERDTHARRARHLVRSGLVALVGGNLFLLAGRLPETMPHQLAIQIGVVSPLALLVLAYLSRAKRPFRREAALTSSLVLVLLGAVLAFWRSPAANAGYGAASFGLFLLYANAGVRPRFGWALGFSLLELAAMVPAMLLHPGLPPSARAQLVLGTLCTAAAALQANYAIESAERRAYLLLLRQLLGAADLADSNAALSSVSTTDWLTGIASRRGLHAKLEWAVAQAEAACEPVALAMIDVDHFKAFNDAQGQRAGDASLAAIAAALGAQLRDGLDTLARYGGEAFAAILPRLDAAGAIMAAERLRRAVEALAIPHAGTGAPCVTISIGVAVSVPHLGGTLDRLMREADTALYAAKQRGRNRVHPPLLSTVDEPAAVDRLATMGELAS